MGDWRDYINYLIGDSFCNTAFILDKNTCEVWASTENSEWVF
jgi:hypothetical protein